MKALDREFTAAMVTLAELPPGAEPDERPCQHCRTLCREELLVEADVRLWPMEEICETCNAELLSDLEDEMPSDAELRRREAAVRFGGGGWVDE